MTPDTRFHVLITDYAWDSLDIERAVLGPIGADLIVAETGDEAELVALAPQADAILTNWKRVTADVLDAAPRCRIVSRYGVGIDNIAVDHATDLGILVTNVPDYCVEEVSDHALALLMASARSIPVYDRGTQVGRWDLPSGKPMYRMRGRTLGIIGCGKIGMALAAKARGIGLRVLGYGPRVEEGDRDGVTFTRNLTWLLSESDYVSLNVPLTTETNGLVDAHFLRQMKPSAFLINTARGAIIDEPALAEALKAGVIHGAALDVLSAEPPPTDHPLLGLPNCLITPHCAFTSVEALAELQQRSATHVALALKGELPPHIVNPAVLDLDNLRVWED
ncbi:MAG: C-terminal binding protein [Anaerolineae bacterium]